MPKAEFGCRRGTPEKAEPTQLRNEASLNCVSLRSWLDCEVSCEAVKGQDERRRSAAPLTASQLTPEAYGARKKTSKVSLRRIELCGRQTKRGVLWSRIFRLCHGDGSERVPCAIQFQSIRNFKLASHISERVLESAQSGMACARLLRRKHPTFSCVRLFNLNCTDSIIFDRVDTPSLCAFPIREQAVVNPGEPWARRTCRGATYPDRAASS